MSVFGKCKGGGRRSAPREVTPLIAIFTTVSYSHGALVLDISATGVRLRGERLPPPGEAVDVAIETVRAFGTVVWAEDGQCGINFDEPLSASDVSLIRRRVSTMAGLPPQVKAALDDWMTGFARSRLQASANAIVTPSRQVAARAKGRG